MSNRNFNKQVTQSRKPLAVGGILVKLGKAGTKYLKNNPDKVKKIMESPLPKKTKDLSKKFTEMFKDRKVKKRNGSKINDFEELGRVDSEKAYTSKGKKNLTAEKKRIVKKLNA